MVIVAIGTILLAKRNEKQPMTKAELDFESPESGDHADGTLGGYLFGGIIGLIGVVTIVLGAIGQVTK